MNSFNGVIQCRQSTKKSLKGHPGNYRKPKIMNCVLLFVERNKTNRFHVTVRLFSKRSQDVKLTNRFHVAMRAFRFRSQMMSKCDKNKFYRHLLSTTEQTRGNTESVC